MKVGRREFLAMPAFLAASPTGARVEFLRTAFQDYRYRAPYKFGGKEVDRVTLLSVWCRLRSRSGKRADGFAAMPLGNVWSFAAQAIPYDTTLAAMKALALKIARLAGDYPEYAHPLDINQELLPEYLKAAAETSEEMRLHEPIPKLCTLVTASPVDAALHDAFGRLHRRNSFTVCGSDFVRYDLSHYLNGDFRGEYLDQYIQPRATPRIRMYHSVGESDALTAADVHQPIGDGLPETLADWIPYNGVTAIKIELNGNDLAWDVERVAAIDRVTVAAEGARGVREWIYSLDFNGRCPDVQYLLDFEHALKGQAPAAFDRVQYIEQPTARDLASNRENTMFEAAKLRPVVIDESLTGLDALLLAREMGYTGAALKACKGQSETLLMAAATQKYKMFRCVQDLTCPGAALVHSVGIAARVPGVSALEANAREYVPVASRGWEKRFPGIFDVRDGFLYTAGLDGPGLCTST
ncbi:MAG TPA: enolase C-terminal domain-like protein [Bryobacteraceae bacterium]|nr:enolase C-terminal domain-like protein [Bryobacteraceae bacterium]